jgi:hypothetical protein
VAGGSHGGSARPVTVAVAPALFGAGGGRKRMAGPAGPKMPSVSVGPKTRREIIL